jgi:ketosteroid isomerase-like protein
MAEGDVSASAAARAAASYLEHVNAGRDMRPLFAEDAVFLVVTGEVCEGREAIGAYFDGHLAATEPTLRARTIAADGDVAVMELELLVDGSRWHLAAADHFTVDGQGLITRLAVFGRPLPASPDVVTPA